MCYRYSVPKREILEKKFKAVFNRDEPFERIYHANSFELPKLPVIIDKEPKQITLFQWGLIPFWTKNEKDANEIKTKTMNSRAESIFDKPAFRLSATKKHCLVLADGFFEWRYFKGKNYPYYIHLKNYEPFAIAGLWDIWKNKDTKEEINTYSVITTQANPLMEKIHNKKKRMPVILKKENEQSWLSNYYTKEKALSLLVPYDEKEMESYTISKLITSQSEDPNVPEVIKPYSYKELPPINTQLNLF